MNASAPHYFTEVSRAVAEAQRELGSATASASTVLEAELSDIAMMVDASASHVASLEGALEMFDYFERAHDAARTRTELASAVEQHHAVVDAARLRAQAAGLRFIQSIGAAAVGREAAFNAVCARLPQPKGQA